MGSPNAAADAARKKQEAERQALERLIATLRDEAEQIRQASPDEAERMHRRLKDKAGDKRVPMDVRKAILDRAKANECDSVMRATDKLLAEAVAMAASEQMTLRASKLGAGRTLFSKACSLGAPEEFRKATQRLIETIMMTGGVYKPGQATKAKPLDTAPKTPNRAKV